MYIDIFNPGRQGCPGLGPPLSIYLYFSIFIYIYICISISSTQADKAALGWDHLEKVDKHESQKGSKLKLNSN